MSGFAGYEAPGMTMLEIANETNMQEGNTPMAYETIKYEVDDQILTITLNRPDKLNAFNGTMQQELIDAFDAADKDDNVRAIIVTGAGRGFCAGADLSSGANTFDRDARRGPVKRLASGAVDYSDPMVRDGGGQVTLRIFKCLKPVIAAVNGPAVGIGVTMQLAMDIRIASEAARFGFVFSQRGIVPEAASSWFLPRIVGISQALEWCYSGRVFPAQEALAGRLVSKVVPPDDLLPTARALAKEFAAKTAPVSVALIRQMMWRMMGADDPMEAHKVDSRGIYARGRSEDVKEGVVSFLEKRPAEFKNKVSSATCPTISRGGRSASISERPARIGQRDARRRRPAAWHQQDGAIVSKDADGAGRRRLRHAQPGLCEPPEGAGSAGGGHPSRHPAFCRRHRWLRPFRLPFHGRACWRGSTLPDIGQNAWAASSCSARRTAAAKSPIA